MDNVCLPLVQLNPTGDEEDENTFNVIGGDGRWAMFQIMGEWHYENPTGGEGEALLWESGQGYACRERNVLTDVEAVLRIARKFYETSDYAELNSTE